MLRIAELRILAAKAGIRRIETKDGVIRPYDIRGRAMPGPNVKFSRVKGDTADARITSVFRALSKTRTA